MIKFRLYYDRVKKESFLNNISKKGWSFKKFFMGFYIFEKTNEYDYTYRIDLIQGKSKKELEEYYDLIRQSGAELVQTWGIWAFFRKKGNFELYTDTYSKIEQYTRIKRNFLFIAIIETIIAIPQIVDYISHQKKLSLFFGCILILISIVLLYQVNKCNKVIRNLKSQI